MKAFNIKLATFSFAALLLASCSDSNSDGTTNVPIASMNSKIIGSDLMQNTNAQELASRVFNYKSKIATKSRTIDESNSSYFTNILSMPEAPASIPDDAKNLKDYTGWDLPAGTYYVHARPCISGRPAPSAAGRSPPPADLPGAGRDTRSGCGTPPARCSSCR